MRFITITLIVHAPDPVTGEQKSTQDRLSEVLGNARLAEELGFDGGPIGDDTVPARTGGTAPARAVATAG